MAEIPRLPSQSKLSNCIIQPTIEILKCAHINIYSDHRKINKYHCIKLFSYGETAGMLTALENVLIASILFKFTENRRQK